MRYIIATTAVALVVGIALGFVVSRELDGSASAAPRAQAVEEQNLDGSGFIRVREQGVVDVNVVNLPLDAEGRLRVVVEDLPGPTPTATATATPTATTTPVAGPAAPANLIATEGLGANKITLTWDENTEPDLALYRIFRGEDLGGPYPFPVATVSAPTTSFIDSGLTSDTTYYYVITAEDTDGNESNVSNEAFATAP